MSTMNKKANKSFQDFYERFLMNIQLRNFDPENCRAAKKLTERFGKRTQPELLSLAQLISAYTGIQLHREFKRRRSMLLSWYEQNFDVIWPFIEEEVIVHDEDEKEIHYLKTPPENPPPDHPFLEDLFYPLTE